MRSAVRAAAIAVGVAGLVLALAGAIREIVLASDTSISWQTSGALRRLTTEPSWATWAAAAVAAAVGVALIILSVRQLRAPDGGPLVIQFQDDAGGWARLDVRAMERGMRRRLQATLSGVEVHDVRLRKHGESWHVRVVAAVPARDLQAQRARMQALLGEDLLRTGGMRLRRLDLVVDRLTV